MFSLYVACVFLTTAATVVFNFICAQRLVLSGIASILLSLATSILGLSIGLALLLIPAENISDAYVSDALVGWSVGLITLAAIVSTLAGRILTMINCHH
jgi:hypothetical protein